MSLSDLHFDALRSAASQLQARDVDSYVLLKKLLCGGDSASKAAFKAMFTRYYGLNQAGLTDEFRDQYFKLLFSFDRTLLDPHTRIINALFSIKDRQSRNIPCFSFASKLISIHDESQPIFDRYVAGFLGISPPSIGSLEFRVAGFIENLNIIRDQYRRWIADARFGEVTASVFKRIPALDVCRPERVCDFLVWTFGKTHALTRRNAKAAE